MCCSSHAPTPCSTRCGGYAPASPVACVRLPQLPLGVPAAACSPRHGRGHHAMRHSPSHATSAHSRCPLAPTSFTGVTCAPALYAACCRVQTRRGVERCDGRCAPPHVASPARGLLPCHLYVALTTSGCSGSAVHGWGKRWRCRDGTNVSCAGSHAGCMGGHAERAGEAVGGAARGQGTGHAR